jgi:hypothetical protein
VIGVGVGGTARSVGEGDFGVADSTAGRVAQVSATRREAGRSTIDGGGGETRCDEGGGGGYEAVVGRSDVSGITPGGVGLARGA